MFLIVADEIGEREAVVTGNEVEARVRSASIVSVEVTAPRESRCDFPDMAAIAFPEAANAIPVFAIPLAPKNRKIPDLVSIWTEIPRFRNELHLREGRVLMDDVEKRAQAIHLPEFPREGAGQIETEAVDVHFQHPVAERVHDELEDAGVGDIQGVSTPGEI